MASSSAHIPPKGRFSLPEVLKHLESFDCTREGLFDYLVEGRIRAVCYSYRLDQKRVVPIEPYEWPEWFREPCEFAVYAGWIGDTNIDGSDAKIPLHIVPRAARPDLERKLKEGGPAATGATVYVLRDELLRFIKWLQNPRKSRPGRRRKGAGSPTKHDYSEIDARLEAMFQASGRSGFERTSEVIAHLRVELGEFSLPHVNTLRNHIEKWLADRLSATRA